MACPRPHLQCVAEPALKPRSFRPDLGTVTIACAALSSFLPASLGLEGGWWVWNCQALITTLQHLGKDLYHLVDTRAHCPPAKYGHLLGRIKPVLPIPCQLPNTPYGGSVSGVQPPVHVGELPGFMICGPEQI